MANYYRSQYKLSKIIMNKKKEIRLKRLENLIKNRKTLEATEDKNLESSEKLNLMPEPTASQRGK